MDLAAKKCAYNTTTESVPTDRVVTWNTCVCCAYRPIPSRIIASSRRQPSRNRISGSQRIRSDIPPLSNSSPFEPQNPFTCEFLGNYQSVASKAPDWERQLEGDPDKAFLLAGIKNGFRITNKGCKIAEAAVAKNHKSATLHSRRTLVEKELKTQIEQSNYVIAREKAGYNRKANLFAKQKSDAHKHFTRDSFVLNAGCSLTIYVRWSKTIQCREPEIRVTLPGQSSTQTPSTGLRHPASFNHCHS